MLVAVAYSAHLMEASPGQALPLTKWIRRVTTQRAEAKNLAESLIRFSIVVRSRGSHCSANVLRVRDYSDKTTLPLWARVKSAQECWCIKRKVCPGDTQAGSRSATALLMHWLLNALVRPNHQISIAFQLLDEAAEKSCNHLQFSLRCLPSF